ncbi:hypothetical protein LCGC14_2529080 [marine sediment metagenome]|uniref:Uncharacterized protein n=1 Tax=marine sediment metagenome TaxID=412755 RepID=A0A0F9DM85_9ZZZZ
MISLGKIVCQKCSGDLVKEGMYARCVKCEIYWIIVYNPDGSFKYMKKAEQAPRLVKEYIASLNDPRAFEAVNLGTLKRTRANPEPRNLKYKDCEYGEGFCFSCEMYNGMIFIKENQEKRLDCINYSPKSLVDNIQLLEPVMVGRIPVPLNDACQNGRDLKFLHGLAPYDKKQEKKNKKFKKKLEKQFRNLRKG